jgi:hypothetical protein
MLRIPRCSYVVNRQIIVSRPIDIIADPSANLRFTNPASAGSFWTCRAADANFGLNSVQLGAYTPRRPIQLSRSQAIPETGS